MDELLFCEFLKGFIGLQFEYQDDFNFLQGIDDHVLKLIEFLMNCTIENYLDRDQRASRGRLKVKNIKNGVLDPLLLSVSNKKSL